MPRIASSLIALTLVASGAAAGDAPSRKITAALARELARAPSARTEMIVRLDERADLASDQGLVDRRQRRRELVARLRAVAEQSQRPLVAELRRLGVPYRAYWIVNFVWVEGDLDLALRLAARPEVARIEANPRWRRLEPLPDAGPAESAGGTLAPLGIEPSLDQVAASDLWELGYTGQGTVVGGADTGIRWDHDALKPHYRGWNGASVDHAHQWHDAIHSGGGSCGHDAAAPCDPHGHGTHTVGTMVGDDGSANRIGVAPGARWIGCRNMDENGAGTPTTYTECFQWFLAPTDLADDNPDPDLAPDVINNSWGCPDFEGCVDVDILKSVVETVRAAGIVVVASAGNSGPDCSTTIWPPAIYAAAFSVGAVDSTDTPASFSSRGPVTIDGSNRMKPDISAPGVNIRSALPTTASSYGSLSGTSMAGPHVAGLVALLVSVDPSLAGDVDALETLIDDTADHPGTSTQTCGGVSAANFPNNTFGAGRIDALAAASERLPDGLVFRDDFEFRGFARWSEIVP